MKLYVDELPESCATCPCSEFNFDYGYGCNMLDVAIKDAGLKNESCPLQSLADYTKQVRKEVCEEIESELLDFSHKHWRVFQQNGKQYMTDDDIIECLDEILKEIQGEL